LGVKGKVKKKKVGENVNAQQRANKDVNPKRDIPRLSETRTLKNIVGAKE